MSAAENRPEGSSSTPAEGYVKPSVFDPPAPKAQGMSLSVWLIAGAVVLLLLVGILVATHNKSSSIKGVQPLAEYAPNLPITNLKMSESTSLSGGKSTFIDGSIRNAGSATVNSVTVQVLFHNDEQMPPQIETVPLALIRTHEPYVDTQPVSAAPLRPGDEKEFRLIFESIPTNWNMQMPEIHVVQVATR